MKDSMFHFDDIDWSVFNDPLEVADQAIETLRVISLQFMQQPHSTRCFLYREAACSSRMAGSKSTLLELLCFEEASGYLFPDSGYLEQSRHLAALDFGLEQLRQDTLNAGVIQGVFGLLCPGAIEAIPKDRPRPWIRIMAFLTHISILHPIIQAGLLHSWVAVEKPFPVANDQMARILCTLSLAQGKTLLAPGLGMSPYFEIHAEAYARFLHSQEEGENHATWLPFFLEGVRYQAVDTTRRLQELLKVLGQYRCVVLRQRRGTHVALLVMEHLMRAPLLTARSLKERMNLSAPTAQRAIQIWVEAGALQEITGHRSGRIYLATDLFRLATEEWQVVAA